MTVQPYPGQDQDMPTQNMPTQKQDKLIQLVDQLRSLVQLSISKQESMEGKLAAMETELNKERELNEEREKERERERELNEVREKERERERELNEVREKNKNKDKDKDKDNDKDNISVYARCSKKMLFFEGPREDDDAEAWERDAVAEASTDMWVMMITGSEFENASGTWVRVIDLNTDTGSVQHMWSKKEFSEYIFPAMNLAEEEEEEEEEDS